MSRPSAPTPERPDLDALLKRAVAEFEALSPEQQRERRAAQRKSWVVGEMMLSNPQMSREECERIFDEVELKK